ncbi:response regulator [Zunongwangia pacifica]|uniref:Response regulator n=1 Tax=Zunongwangia pacifica TaxID=2911062 RepID=A0A9X1ZPH6_9FLAO|nr:response regulator [Zunongwangia pacifica]MCL6216895.1 response regulator [Zunongwangia pacifica]
METVIGPTQIDIAFINDESPLLDLTCNALLASGIDVLFRSGNIEDGLSRLSALTELPQVCVVDLDFDDIDVLHQLQELKAKYSSIHLIAHSDNNSEKTAKSLLKMGFDGYLLVGSDADDFRKAIEGACNGKKYFSMGLLLAK